MFDSNATDECPYKDLNTMRETNIVNWVFQVVSALHYLYSQLRVIHRDVKPSNILINRKGEVKICDFGISGYLVDSVAKTIDAGCKPYMAVRIRNHILADNSKILRFI